MEKKKICLFSKSNDDERFLFQEILGERYDIAFLDWETLRGGELITRIDPKSERVFLERDEMWRLSDFDVLHVLSMGKFEKKERDVALFFNTLEQMTSKRIKPPFMINPPRVMMKNLNKSYLVELQENSISTIPTVELKVYTPREEIIKRVQEKSKGSLEDVVLKPKIFGERANSVIRLNETDDSNLEGYFLENKSRGVLAQAFIPDVELYHERSLVYVSRKFSHAALRYRGEGWLPPTGTLGRLPEKIKPSKQELKVCEKILDFKGKNYAPITRFDVIGRRDFPMISEVEEINPSIYLSRLPDSDLIKFFELYQKGIEEYFSGKFTA
ncbi:hypothetical protein K0A97_00680 [Patescibacteria group bacterium]|nr:hypothetical protein [Patescibacteria group bacterium]